MNGEVAMKIGIALLVGALGANAAVAADYDVAAYVWPAYHPAGRWAELGIFKDGKGEWQNVYESTKRYPDDLQDARPLWGYENEADPIVVARKIDAATAAGVNVFIYDWYWYDGRPFLEEALEKGFLKAPNNERMRFYIMWANHDVNNLWNNRIGGAAKRKLIWSAKVSDEDFRTIVRHWINAYFKRPNYYKIKGCPVLSIYRVASLVEGGGLEKAREKVAYLRAEVKKAGFPDVHIQQVGAKGPPVQIGADSMTIYNWNYRTLGRLSSTNEPELTYRQYGELSLAQFEVAKREAAAIGATYYPHLACGWDTNARYPAGEKRNIVHGRNPQDFETFARRVRDWADANLPAEGPRLITVNSWNEWTEGSYLEPDDKFGYGYLEALRKVFVEHN